MNLLFDECADFSGLCTAAIAAARHESAHTRALRELVKCGGEPFAELFGLVEMRRRIMQAVRNSTVMIINEDANARPHASGGNVLGITRGFDPPALRLLNCVQIHSPSRVRTQSCTSMLPRSSRPARYPTLTLEQAARPVELFYEQSTLHLDRAGTGTVTQCARGVINPSLPISSELISCSRLSRAGC